MKLFKKMAFTVLILLISTGAVFAGGGSQGGGSGGGAGGKKQVLTFLYDKSSAFEGIQAVIDAFEVKYNVEVELEVRPAGTEGDNIIKTRLATGDMTDIFIYNTGSLLHALNPERNLVDLTGESYYGNLDNAFVTAASVNNRLYGIPSASAMIGGWLYSKKIYKELGLQVPRTWAELLANLEKCKAAGKTGLLASYKESWTAQLIILSDEYNVKALAPNFPADYTAGKAKYATTPVALRGFQKYAETRAYLNSDFMATTYNDAMDMLINGKGVHWPMLTNALSNMYALYGDKVDDIGVFGQPGDDPNNQGLTVWATDGLYIYKNSPNVELAKKFFEFYVSEEGIKAFLSVVKPNGPMHIKNVSLPANVYEGVRDMLPYFNSGKTAPALEFESPVKGPNLEQLCIEVGSGNLTPQAGAAAYDADVQKQAIQLGLSGW
ncbi:ABC transporter substrate-binding protein [Treponema primitia]|uniref:ABC transporter substrate-binding protein n=1 Tax=Treponema primitia TaxID=88058 RepID=UPI0002554EBE|nr:ABC transporter substrate-binding protein [Treponema primitia]